MIVADKSTAPPSAIKLQEEEGVEEDEEEPGEEKNKKSPDDYQSAVARHLLENEACLRAYTDNSFCIVCVCLFFEVLVLGCNGSLVYSFLITQPLCPKVISHIPAVVPHPLVRFFIISI